MSDLARRPGAAPETIATRTGLFGNEGSGDTSGYGRLTRAVELGGTTTPPFGGYFDDLLDNLRTALASHDVAPDAAIEKAHVHVGELTVFIARDYLPIVAAVLRDEPALRFELCRGVSGVHYPDDTGRELHAVYPLQSITHNRVVRLEVCAPDADPHIPSICRVYPTNDWHERETYDFFGIVFDGHHALTRIEMPDDWEGHPQRKDYPLGGVPVEYKGTTVQPPDRRRSYK
ncbi:NADH-quinone oxidoreductase subunit C [Gordonia sp. (in: high G+C Gram-positive bacteria)]|uniref:NADH-quinone oxidoreductase subunit C n=1 Tax=Gordonia sp. (in: high G+C Gram-positive bacteria) TaxID=84139 RepID=UPI0039E61785